MFKYNILILVFGNKNRFVDRINNADIIDCCTVKAEAISSLKDERISCCSALIIDDVCSYSDLYPLMENKNINIIISLPNAITEDKDFSNKIGCISDFWQSDMPEILFNVRYNQIIENVKEKHDHILCEKCLEILMNNLPNIVWIKDLDGAHIKVNDLFCNTVNKPREDIIGKTHPYVWNVSEEDYNKGKFVCKETDEYVIKTKKSGIWNEKIILGNKSRILNTHKSPVMDDCNNIYGTIGIAFDDTDLRNLRNELAIVLNNMPFETCILSLDKKIVTFNNLFLNMIGMTKEEATGKSLDEVFGDNFSLTDSMDSTVSKKYMTIKKGKKKYDYNFIETEINDTSGEKTGYLNIFRDISDERRYESHLEYLAERDELTKLLNRRAINKKINDNKKSKYSKAVLMLDIDDFKRYNDTYGHMMGDIVLEKIGKVLNDVAVNNKVIPIRYGGEEFVIIIRNKSLDFTKNIAENIMNKIKALEIEHSQSTIDTIITCSMGVYYSENHNESDDEAIAKADKAMYHAKKSGKNQIYTYE